MRWGIGVVRVGAGMGFSRREKFAAMELMEGLRVREGFFCVLLVFAVEWWGMEDLMLRVGVY